MELKIEQYQLPSTITANWDEIKQEIAVKLKDYSVMSYSDEEIGRAKADKAYLNKLKKAINDERIRLEREYMKPFDEFKSKAKEVIALIEQPIAKIDEQIKAADEKRKQQKQMEIGSLFVCTEFPSWVRLDMIQDAKWLNATYKMSDIKDEMQVKKAMIEGDLKTLSELSYAYEATEEYKRTLNLNLAISEGQRLSELQRKKEIETNAQKAQEEAKPVAPTEIPSEPIKAQEEPPVEQDMASWRSFGGFLTDKQVDALYKWCADNDITITEV